MGHVAKIMVLLNQVSCAEAVPRGMQGFTNDKGNIHAFGDACSLREKKFVFCSPYIHNDIVSGGHMKSKSAVLAEICGMFLNQFKFLITEADGCLIVATIGERTRIFGSAPCQIPNSWLAAHLFEVLVLAGLIRAWAGSNDVMLKGQPFTGLFNCYLKEFVFCRSHIAFTDELPLTVCLHILQIRSLFAFTCLVMCCWTV